MQFQTWLRRLGGPWTAGVILAGFWLAMVASVRDKSLTVDEPVHAVAGYSYWRFGDYRLNPENGNLPQRWMALPLVLARTPFPKLDSPAWRSSDEGSLGVEWFYGMGNDPEAMALRGRAWAALLAVALGALVWSSSRRLFGPSAALLSLLLFVLNPSILANGPLMTSDTACALFFLASVLALGAVFERISPGRLGLSLLAVGGLFVSKMSAALIVPMAVALALVRIFSGPPVEFAIGRPRVLASRRSRAGAFALVGLAHVAAVVLVIWAFDGFRYSAFSPALAGGGRLEYTWSDALGGPAGARSAVGRTIGFFRAHHLLPEAYLFGQAHAWRDAQTRSAFLNGRHSLTGWPWFFPYTVLVKTPLPVFAVALLAAVALVRRFPRGALPLVALLGFYWVAAIANHLNIGHRHVLATYPPLFILCGAAVLIRAKPARWLVAGLVAALAAETALAFPDYLAYFNVLGGGKAGAYRHLVDSSLDWGQDLPGLKRFLDGHPSDRPAYLSYFGIASPAYYRLPVRYLYGVRGQDVPPPVRTLAIPAAGARAKLADFARDHPDYQLVSGARRPDGGLDVAFIQTPASLRIGAGTYVFSASMLQSVMYDLRGPLGSWNARYERTYRALGKAVGPLLDDDLSKRDAALPRYSPYAWSVTLTYFEMFRLARLAAYLRQREPDATIGGSLLVYRVSDADLSRALEGPPPELGPDLPVESGLFHPPSP